MSQVWIREGRTALDNITHLQTLAPVRAPAPDPRESLEVLTRVCADDVLNAFGLGNVRRGRSALAALFSVPARRLARQVMTYDRIVGEAGLGAGGAWAMKQLARRAEVSGQENVPREGPVLLVSNHPGLADTVALFDAISRADLRVVAAARPFLSELPNTSRYLLTVDEASPGRLGLVRAAARHLGHDGAVLTFPGGRIEPDPAVLPGAIESLERWSASVDLFSRLTPGLTVVPAVVSGVLSPAALRNPLTRLRRHGRDREWLAATLQMLTPTLRDTTVQVRFGEPIRSEANQKVSDEVISEMKRLLEWREAAS